MAVIQPPNWLQNGTYSANTDRLLISSLVQTSGIVSPSDLTVTAQISPEMSVKVGVGAAFIRGTSEGFQGTYHAVNDGPVTINLALPSPTNPRIDLIVLKIYDSTVSGDSDTASLEVITGNAQASPVSPDIPENSIALARVTVPVLSTGIISSNIQDIRLLATFRGGIQSNQITTEKITASDLSLVSNNARLEASGNFTTNGSITVNGNGSFANVVSSGFLDMSGSSGRALRIPDSNVWLRYGYEGDGTWSFIQPGYRFNNIIAGSITANGNFNASGSLSGSSLSLAGGVTAGGSITSSGTIHSQSGYSMGSGVLSIPASNAFIRYGFEGGDGNWSFIQPGYRYNGIVAGPITANGPLASTSAVSGFSGSFTESVNAQTFNASGNLNAANSVVTGISLAPGGHLTSSSRRYKDNVTLSPKTLEDLLNIQIVEFTYKSDENKKNEIGIIAEDLITILPEAVYVNEEGSAEAIDYGKVSALAIIGVQSLYRELKETQKEVESLKEAIEDIKRDISNMKE
jgi:hypothetical protein